MLTVVGARSALRASYSGGNFMSLASLIIDAHSALRGSLVFLLMSCVFWGRSEFAPNSSLRYFGYIRVSSSV
jgi:hypothetical protein